jgi:NifU-like protein involved in Fe-S cluster formation
MSLGRGKYRNADDGDTIALDVDLRANTVAVTGMDLRCCNAATRSARALADWAYGKTPEDAARIESRELIDRLALTPKEERCALTAIAAFRAALMDAHLRDVSDRRADA